MKYIKSVFSLLIFIIIVFAVGMFNTTIAQNAIKKDLNPQNEVIKELKKKIQNLGDSIKNVSTSQKALKKPITEVENRILELSKLKYVEGRHIFSYYLGGGLSTFQFNPNVGTHKNGYGFTTGFDYSYFWNNTLGLNLGFSFDRFTSSFSLNNLETSTPAIDGDLDNDGIPEPFNLLVAYNGFKEKQSAYYIGIPIQMRFRKEISSGTTIIGGIGPKLSFAVNSKSQITDGSYVVRGFYPQHGSTAILPVGPGFGEFTPRNSNSMNVNFGASFAADFYVAFKINQVYSFYTGPYFEYQMNNGHGDKDKPLVRYEVKSQVSAQSVYQPVMNSNAIDKYNRVAAGLKIGLFFDTGGYKNRKVSKQKEQAQMEAQRLNEQLNRLNELRKQFIADSISNALKLAELNRLAAELRAREVADSISNALRLAELARLAEAKRIQDSIANAKEVAVIMDIKTKTLSEEELALLKLPIIFQKGSAEITDQSKINANRIGEMLALHPDLLLAITGHTCDLGDDKVNYRLGLRRAQTLFREFTQAGVIATQVSTFSKGELEPLYPNINEENRRKNRRVVVVIEDDLKKTKEERIFR